MNILLLYNATQTFTNTVFEHVDAFSRFSAHRYFYCHHDVHVPFDVDLTRFDAVGFHYSVRFAYDQVSAEAQRRLQAYRGLKFLFIQDEYESTCRAWHWIQALGVQLVFTVVPEANIARVYPPQIFPGVRFVSTLTGYVPEEAPAVEGLRPPSSRELMVGYRGRPLPLVQFGALAFEKTQIGQMVRAYCRERGIAHDIEWREDARIYGPRWYEFVASCRAMLGTESGSNVFDWDGRLRERVAAFHAEHPEADDLQVYRALVEHQDMHGLMNQVSPRVFEAISLRTVLVLFEGTYSGVVEPWKHFIPLRKDGSNLDEVFERLADGAFVDAMAERAYEDVIASGRFSYASLVRLTDRELAAAAALLPAAEAPSDTGTPRRQPAESPTAVTTHAVRAAPPQVHVPAPQPEAAPEPQPLPAEEPDCVAAIAVLLPAQELPRVDLARHLGDVRSQQAQVQRALRMTRMKNLVVTSWQLVPPGVRPVLRPVARAGVLPAWRLLRRAYSKLRP